MGNHHRRIKNSSSCWLLAMLSFLLNSETSNSFVLQQQPYSILTIIPRLLSSTSELHAKKKKGKSAGQGFGKEPVENVSKPKAMEDVGSAIDSGLTQVPSSSSFLTSVEGGSDAIPKLDSDLPIEERTSAILRDKYGLRTREEQQEEYRRQQAVKEQRKKLEEWKKLADQGEDFDIMRALPPPVLVGIDRFLKVGVAVCTVMFVLAGIGITIEAWSKTSGTELPEDLDNFIVNVVEPNFTPGLGVLLAFSISLGAFAAAQLSSSSSTYREDR